MKEELKTLDHNRYGLNEDFTTEMQSIFNDVILPPQNLDEKVEIEKNFYIEFEQ